jgi:hypothetical protein
MMNYAQRWQQMTPEQQQRAQQGKNRWDAMTPQQRAKARSAFERGAASLSPQDRAALRERLKSMTPEQRREWLQNNREQLQRPHRRGPHGPGMREPGMREPDSTPPAAEPRP